MQSHYCYYSKSHQTFVKRQYPPVIHVLFLLSFAFLSLVPGISHAETPISMDGMMYKLATEQNDAAAQYFIGRNYLVGKSVSIDKREAAKWFAKAAEQSHTKAEYELGKLYLKGDGVKQNYKVAFKLITSAAKRNHTDAQFILGKLHLKDISGLSKPNEAVKWLNKATINNHISAMYMLGKLFYEGKIIKGKRQDGKKLLEEAADLGDPQAIKYLESKTS